MTSVVEFSNMEHDLTLHTHNAAHWVSVQRYANSCHQCQEACVGRDWSANLPMRVLIGTTLDAMMGLGMLKGRLKGRLSKVTGRLCYMWQAG